MLLVLIFVVVSLLYPNANQAMFMIFVILITRAFLPFYLIQISVQCLIVPTLSISGSLLSH